MNKKIFSLLLLAFIASCSRVNVASQDHYKEQHMRHGVVPLGNSIQKNMSQTAVMRGKALYEKNCLSCHGKSGQGDGPLAKNNEHRPANLQKLVREVPNFMFFISISQWQGDMPGWKEQFNEVEREELVAYIKTFK